jgi:hypothetical protein
MRELIMSDKNIPQANVSLVGAGALANKRYKIDHLPHNGVVGTLAGFIAVQEPSTGASVLIPSFTEGGNGFFVLDGHIYTEYN